MVQWSSLGNIKYSNRIAIIIINIIIFVETLKIPLSQNNKKIKTLCILYNIFQNLGTLHHFH